MYVQSVVIGVQRWFGEQNGRTPSVTLVKVYVTELF